MEPVAQEERNWAVLCHLAAFAGFLVPFGHILGPLVVWLLKRGEFQMVDDQGKEAINFQISNTIYFLGIVGMIALLALVSLLVVLAGASQAFLPFSVALLGLGLFATAMLVLFDVIAVVVAATRTSSGEHYRYPAAIRFLF